MAALLDDQKINIINNLKNIYSGVANVPTIYHNVDILTPEKIIQVTQIENWMEGIAKLTLQAGLFPNKTKHLHIYRINNNNDLLNKVLTATQKLNIVLTIEQ